VPAIYRGQWPRHTYASRLAMRNVPLAVIAAQLGHSDARMVEKHYGHLSPGYVADTVRAAFGTLGIVEASNVVTIAATREHLLAAHSACSAQPLRLGRQNDRSFP
jgi:hypothetical protein